MNEPKSGDNIHAGPTTFESHSRCKNRTLRRLRRWPASLTPMSIADLLWMEKVSQVLQMLREWTLNTMSAAVNRWTQTRLLWATVLMTRHLWNVLGRKRTTSLHLQCLLYPNEQPSPERYVVYLHPKYFPIINYRWRISHLICFSLSL